MFRYSEEKWKKEMIQSVPKCKEVSVIVWAAFIGKAVQIFTNWPEILNPRKRGTL